MAKIAALDPRSLAWARGEFARYYAEVPVEAPSRLARREFAAFPFASETLMRRHLSIPSPTDLGAFLRREVPRHAYYSSAYYRIPDHPKMDGKEWLGADLIFDLDADHLRGAATLRYAEQLALVKERVARLYDDFLVGDFGIDPAEMSLVFSGGRGYHIHVHAAPYLPLTSPERRELVDYVQGTGFDAAHAVLESREDGAATAVLGLDDDERPTRRGGSRAYRRLHPPDTPGWRGRTTRAVLALLERWELQGLERTVAELEERGLPRARARSLVRLLLTQAKGRKIRESLSLEVFAREVPPEFFDVVLRQAAVEVQGETDAPVTTDINRLIRLPGSLHGGTGFRVTRLPRDALDRFEPLRDALLPGRGHAVQTVELAVDLEYPFARPVRGTAGERLELPTPEALFLVLRGEAALPT